MLTNNGINALKMNRDYTFTNVIGGEYAFTDITGHSNYNAGGYNAYYFPMTPYNSTTDSNDCTDEQTAYKFALGVSNQSGAYYQMGCSFIYAGSGTDEVTEDDYKLSSALALTSTSAECIASGGVINTMRTFINDTEEDVTVTETGLYIVKCSSSTQYPVMIARQILSTPVTIGVNETYTFTYTLNLTVTES